MAPLRREWEALKESVLRYRQEAHQRGAGAQSQ